MNLFESVKNAVSTREAAKQYGICVSRSGMCKCPFHDDSGPDTEKQEIVQAFLHDQQTNQEETMEPINTTPVYYETAAYARENGELELFWVSHRTNNRL